MVDRRKASLSSNQQTFVFCGVAWSLFDCLVRPCSDSSSISNIIRQDWWHGHGPCEGPLGWYLRAISVGQGPALVDFVHIYAVYKYLRYSQITVVHPNWKKKTCANRQDRYETFYELEAGGRYCPNEQFPFFCGLETRVICSDYVNMVKTHGECMGYLIYRTFRYLSHQLVSQTKCPCTASPACAGCLSLGAPP